MKGARRRPLTPAAGRIYTALTRNALQRQALDAQRHQLITEALDAGYRYRDIADALHISVGATHKIANTPTEDDSNE